MSKELISKLKPWVSTFSEAIRYNYKRSDQLRVGGEITSILDVSELFTDPQPKDDMVHIVIDDNVGNILLMVPKDAYKILDKEYAFKKGMIILAEGRLLDFEKVKNPTKATEQIEPSPAATLVCWLVEPYKEK